MTITSNTHLRLLIPCLLLISNTAWSSNTLTCTQTAVAPTIDGLTNDSAWKNSQELSIADYSSQLHHKLACVYDNERIYIKARFSDTTESRTHKTGVWSDDEKLYSIDADREDTLLLKWNMGDNKGDLSLSSDKPYKADVWYWKAFRTDPTGYADDKMHIYSKEGLKRAKKRISKRGNRFFLVRRGDKGLSAYKPVINMRHTGSDRVSSYSHREPIGSRADVLAKGHWVNSEWTIEFSRALDTQSADDVRFKTTRRYQFGVSRYEIAGSQPVEDSNNPLHGAGDIEQTATLVFKESVAAH